MIDQNALTKAQRTATLEYYVEPNNSEARANARDVGVLDADNQLTASSTEWLHERLKNVAIITLSNAPGAGVAAKKAGSIAAANIRRENKER